MTLTEIAKTFGPRHTWTTKQEEIVIQAIRSIIGQTFVCNHQNASNMTATVVKPHPHSRGTELELSSPTFSSETHSCDVFHFVQYYTPSL